MPIKLKRAAMLVALGAAVAVGGCARSCSCGGPRGDLTVDSQGNQKRLTELPGQKKSGEFDIHPFNGQPPLLYGPFEAGKRAEFQMRVINKIGQAVDGARLVYDLKQLETAEEHNDACRSRFWKEGIYFVACRFDKPGDWKVKLTAHQQDTVGSLEYQVYVRPAASPPTDADLSLEPPPLPKEEKAKPAPKNQDDGEL
jgi:hypothetical protein